MKSARKRLATAAIAMMVCAVATAGENFRVVGVSGPLAERVTIAADSAYVTNAQWWFGKRFPDLWRAKGAPAPVPITLRSDGGNAGAGATTFDFAKGHAFGWSMTAAGTEKQLLEDVIPHEVNHIVFAAKFRRPLPRWLDEGAAQLMESTTAHKAYRKRTAGRIAKPGGMIPWRMMMDQLDYPRRGRDGSFLLAFYDQSFSMVEYLVGLKGKETFVAFAGDTRKPSEKLREYYGYDADELQARWAEWFKTRAAKGHDCEAFGCTMHTALKPPDDIPLVYALTADFKCPACDTFWGDVRDGKYAGKYRFVAVVRNSAKWRELREEIKKATGAYPPESYPSWYVPGAKRVVTLKAGEGYRAPILIQLLRDVFHGVGALFLPHRVKPPVPYVRSVESMPADIKALIADWKRWKEAGLIERATLIPSLVGDVKRLKGDLVATKQEAGEWRARFKAIVDGLKEAAAGDAELLRTVLADFAAFKNAENIGERIAAGAKAAADLKKAEERLKEHTATVRGLKSELSAAQDRHEELTAEQGKDRKFGWGGGLLATLATLLGVAKRYAEAKKA